jgi:hypothetical protein
MTTRHIKGISHVQLGSGDIILFWRDLRNGRVLKLSYPHLFSFSTNEIITVKVVIEKGDLHSFFFQLPLSEEAYEQYCELGILMQSHHQSTDNDS